MISARTPLSRATMTTSRNMASSQQAKMTAPVRISSSTQRSVLVRDKPPAENEELKLQVASILKTVVKGAAWAIEQGTEVAYGFAPDNMERSTVGLIVKAVVAVIVLSVAQNVLSFAFTLVTFAAIAFIAVNVLNLDVDEILDAAKKPTKK